MGKLFTTKPNYYILYISKGKPTTTRREHDMNLDQYLAAANIIETLVETDEKANELLTEAIGYLNRANSYHDTENLEAQQFHGYYSDTMRRCSRRIMALTGFDKMVIRRALVTVVRYTI